MPDYIAYIVGSIFALAGTIVVWIMVVPDKKRPGLNKFFQHVHDFFNFKTLWIEKILKFLYILTTLTCIATGFFLLFSVRESSSFFGLSTRSEYCGGDGFLFLTVGPIVVRLVYESIMMFILLVKNSIDINNKLNPQEGSVADKASKAAQKKAEEAAAAQQFYTQQQQQYGQQYQYGQQPQQYGQPQQFNKQQQPYEQPQQYMQPQDNNPFQG